jgi:uncharacterized membrane protein
MIAMGRRSRTDVDVIIGYTLSTGVLVSLVLLVVGLAWHWVRWETLRLDYTLPATSVAGLVATDVQQLTTAAARPRLLVNLGIAVLMLTPYIRVLASMLYFVFAERNVKYAVFTALVLAMLTYSLVGP